VVYVTILSFYSHRSARAATICTTVVKNAVNIRVVLIYFIGTPDLFPCASIRKAPDLHVHKIYNKMFGLITHINVPSKYVIVI
jgi:hypothetical protein